MQCTHLQAQILNATVEMYMEQNSLQTYTNFRSHHSLDLTGNGFLLRSAWEQDSHSLAKHKAANRRCFLLFLCRRNSLVQQFLTGSDSVLGLSMRNSNCGLLHQIEIPTQ